MPLTAMGAGFRTPTCSKPMKDKSYNNDYQLNTPMRLAAKR